MRRTNAVDAADPAICQQIATGMKRALPIVLGYVPIGFAYGVLAGKSGISEANALLMSLIVFAGSAQFIAVGLFASGTGPAAVIVTTFVVNLRHLLMAASLAPHMSAWKKKYLSFFAFELTDETFALHSTRVSILNQCRPEALALNVAAQASWVAGTILGLFAAELIGDVKPLGLDYALAAMFIGLLVGQCDSIIKIVTAILGGGIATVLFLAGFQQFHIIIATVIAATAGLGVEQWIKK
ncbi:AzlC family ABC transporter permease [Desulforhopalus singaporensis]|uniref:4-azaleucine resistance probable transporter AzlC n=1 Tax=Desulforhopalus singaporensis TaxID=91360 RepID=A0A1H0UAB0_9BACT|nr:AzlC family ABC transporter permease [Desulforhopalus singaporensis]SDP62766.1 4-azaleucine resistance probable transporter AzlC [Desulforhopalus singaporensis]